MAIPSSACVARRLQAPPRSSSPGGCRRAHAASREPAGDPDLQATPTRPMPPPRLAPSHLRLLRLVPTTGSRSSSCIPEPRAPPPSSSKMSTALVPFLSFLRFALLISLSVCIAAAAPRHGFCIDLDVRCLASLASMASPSRLRRPASSSPATPGNSRRRGRQPPSRRLPRPPWPRIRPVPGVPRPAKPLCCSPASHFCLPCIQRRKNASTPCFSFCPGTSNCAVDLASWA
ncbi:translation initiation factor IF-2-like [Triticum dicoccoides]|uniref:translation initiation factor IF-2-like n=1 Tax=Triticum dicoccoides TaxID=85692 RepID=UPI0018907EB1|nr:translation initiation factor IF-2-like [Triticum dicoccoides]